MFLSLYKQRHTKLREIKQIKARVDMKQNFIHFYIIFVKVCLEDVCPLRSKKTAELMCSQSSFAANSNLYCVLINLLQKITY